MSNTWKTGRKTLKNQNGFTLVEVLIAAAVLLVASVAFVSGFGTSLKILSKTDVHDTARDLAQSQMEYIQDQTYDSTNNPPVYQLLSDIPNSYTIATPLAERLDKGSGITTDTGIQKITIAVSQNGSLIYTLEGYKVKW